MNCLAIDTATECLGVCLKTGGTCISLNYNFGFHHARYLVPLVQYICAQAAVKPGDLDLVIASLGPGSFTGLRIGLATGKGLAHGADCALVGVPTLEAMAYSLSFFPGIVIPVLDAKKDRLYCGLFRAGERITRDMDIPPEQLTEMAADIKGPLLLTGNHASAAYERLKAVKKDIALDPEYFLVKPYSLLELGIKLYNTKGKGEDTLEPLYLRKSEAEVKSINPVQGGEDGHQ